MPSTLVYIVIVSLVVVWLIVLTYLYISSVRHYKRFQIEDGESLEKAVNTMFKGLGELHENITSATDRVSHIEKDNIKHVQKVALKRFNPFGDTGGNQSFSVTFLDGNNDGVVFSSLHGRSGTRVYSKPVKSGKQQDYELSDEEQDVINLAIKEN